MDTEDLLRRISVTLREEIAPEVGEEYIRTQTFMASVILERVARQLGSAEVHADAERADLTGLHRELAERLAGDGVPAEVREAAGAAGAAGTVASLGPLVSALHAWGPDREPAAADALARVRQVLRADIDRRMEIAR